MCKNSEVNNITGEYLEIHHPASKLSLFSAPMTNESESGVKAAYANLFAAKKLQERYAFKILKS